MELTGILFQQPLRIANVFSPTMSDAEQDAAPLAFGKKDLGSLTVRPSSIARHVKVRKNLNMKLFPRAF